MAIKASGNTLSPAAAPERYPRPEHLASPSQRALVELADEILALRPDDYRGLTWSEEISADPKEVLSRLRDPQYNRFSDMMLPDGHPLAFRGRRRGYDHVVIPAELLNLGIAARESELSGVQISAYGTQSPPTDRNTAVGWHRQAVITLWYTNGERYAGEQLKIADSAGSTPKHRQVPSVYRGLVSPVNVWHSPRGEHVDYSEHSIVTRANPEDQEIVHLLSYMHELFRSR